MNTAVEFVSNIGMGQLIFLPTIAIFISIFAGFAFQDVNNCFGNAQPVDKQ